MDLSGDLDWRPILATGHKLLCLPCSGMVGRGPVWGNPALSVVTTLGSQLPVPYGAAGPCSAPSAFIHFLGTISITAETGVALQSRLGIPETSSGYMTLSQL